MPAIEIFGTVASAIIALSLMMRNLKWLRIINAAGALAFTAYGLMIGAMPVIVLNVFIVGIDLYFLWKMRSQRDRFDTIESDPFASPYVKLFLEHYKADIARFHPDFKLEPGRGWKTEFILRDLNPVSIIIYRQVGPDAVEISLDYAVPSYRDFKSAEYYFGKAAERIAAGQRLRLLQTTSVPKHRLYLERLGFKPVESLPEGGSRYEKLISGRAVG